MKSSSTTTQSWVLLTALFTIANLLEIVLFSNLSYFTPLFLQNIGFDERSVNSWTGPLASAGILLGFWFVPFWGVLADRYGRKLLIIRSYIVEVVAVMLMAFSTNVWIFLLGRTMTGLALGNSGLMFATLTDRAPRERVALAISIVTGSTPVGIVIGSLVGGFIVAHWGVNVLFGFLSVMISGVVLMLWLFFHETFVPGTPYPLTLMLRTALRAVVRTPVVLTLFAFSFLATLGYFFSYPYVPNRIVELVGKANSGEMIGLVVGISGVATVIATPLWGLAADRFGQRRLLPVVTLLTGLLFLPLYWAGDVVQFTVRLFLLNGVQPAVNSLTFATIGLETPPERRASVMSMIYMPLNAAILFAPSLAAAVALASEVRTVFLVSAIVTIVAFLMIVMTSRTKPSTSAAPAE